MSSRLMSAEKGRGKHAEQAGECGRVSALAEGLREAYGRTDGSARWPKDRAQPAGARTESARWPGARAKPTGARTESAR